VFWWQDEEKQTLWLRALVAKKDNCIMPIRKLATKAQRHEEK